MIFLKQTAVSIVWNIDGWICAGLDSVQRDLVFQII